MKLTEIKPKDSLKQLLSNAGVSVPIYANNDMPTDASLLPAEFISISQNGLLNSYTRELSFITSTLALSLSEALLSNGATNVKKEKLLLDIFEESINGKSLGDNYFEYDLSNLMTDSRNITAGYSTKIINVKVKTYKK